MINIRPIAVWYQWIWTRVAMGECWEWMRCGWRNERERACDDWPNTVQWALLRTPKNGAKLKAGGFGESELAAVEELCGVGLGAKFNKFSRETIEIYVAFLRLGLHQWSANGMDGAAPLPHSGPIRWISFF